MTEGGKNRLAEAYAIFSVTRAETGELRVDIAKQKANETAHNIPKSMWAENNTSLMHVVREVEADYASVQKDLLEVAARTPGRYELVSLARVIDRSTAVLELRYLEARFAVPVSAGKGQEMLCVTRQESAFCLDTHMGFSELGSAVSICIPDDPNRLPTISLPFNTTYPLETRIIERTGVSSVKASIDPLLQQVVGV